MYNLHVNIVKTVQTSTTKVTHKYVLSLHDEKNPSKYDYCIYCTLYTHIYCTRVQYRYAIINSGTMPQRKQLGLLLQKTIFLHVHVHVNTDKRCTHTYIYVHIHVYTMYMYEFLPGVCYLVSHFPYLFLSQMLKKIMQVLYK